ncbi:MAG: hypothetical protein J1E60_01640 [Christensenellaceae bacterium]|nr:hypothetical protein [Christensenellaceae bacterium]
MFKRKNKDGSDELNAALSAWRDALKRFETAADDEVRFIALEVEAARQKYIYMLNKRRDGFETSRASSD